MKHTAPSPDTLILKRKGHKRHHRQQNYHLARWFWVFFILFTTGAGLYIWNELTLRRNTTQRIQSEIVTNMETILKALNEYHRVNGMFPPAYETNSRGDRTLSWRVALLPYFLDGNGQPKYQDLYDSFNRAEAWSHKDNLALLNKMPHEYRSPRCAIPATGDDAGKLTNYLVVRNPNSVFPDDCSPVSKSRITDRLDETVLVIEVSDEAAIEWTKPDDFEFDPARRETAAPKMFQPDVLICGMSNCADVVPVAIPTPISSLFEKNPKLSPEELAKANPLTPYFLRNDSETSDLPALTSRSDATSDNSASNSSDSNSDTILPDGNQ